jgi:hypothetical protein
MKTATLNVGRCFDEGRGVERRAWKRVSKVLPDVQMVVCE